MIRIGTLAGALGLLAASPAFAQMSGMLLCQQDLNQVRAYVAQNQASLSEDQLNKARAQLQVAESQCNESPQLGNTTLSSLRNDLKMKPMDPQAAQTPGSGGKPGRTPD